MAGVVYSPKALSDIERIRDYIRDVLLDPDAAARFVQNVFDAGDSLVSKPRPGAPFRSNLEVLACYRYLTVGRYLMVFRIQDDTAKIVRVLHELQDSVSILIREV